MVFIIQKLGSLQRASMGQPQAAHGLPYARVGSSQAVRVLAILWKQFGQTPIPVNDFSVKQI